MRGSTLSEIRERNAQAKDAGLLLDAQLWVLDHGGEQENNIGYVLDSTVAKRLAKRGWIKMASLGIRAEMTEAGYEAIKPLAITGAFVNLMEILATEYIQDRQLIFQRNLKACIEKMGIEVDAVKCMTADTMENSIQVFMTTRYMISWNQSEKKYSVYNSSHRNYLPFNLTTVYNEVDQAQMVADYINNLLDGERNINKE